MKDPGRKAFEEYMHEAEHEFEAVFGRIPSLHELDLIECIHCDGEGETGNWPCGPCLGLGHTKTNGTVLIRPTDTERT